MKHKPRYRTKGKRARRSLRLPDLEHAKAAVLNRDADARLVVASQGAPLNADIPITSGNIQVH